MLALNNMKIGKKNYNCSCNCCNFSHSLSNFFSNNALKSDKKTLNEIVDVKFELYKASSKLLIDVDLYNSVLYKVFSFATGGYEQSQIDEQLALLEKKLVKRWIKI